MMKTDPAASHAKQKIESSEIHKQVETALQKLEQVVAPTPQKIRSILKARSRTLAKEINQNDQAKETLDIIEFRLATETYGIESVFVREVYPLTSFTPLPGTPSFMLGIVNVRGQILSMVDLKKFFNLPEKGLGQLNKLIILRNEQMEFAILADDIFGASVITLDAIQTSPPTVSGIGAVYLHGVTAEHIIILNAEKILNDGKIIVHQESD
jgi:purine-binding chemotaxis protein CheW